MSPNTLIDHPAARASIKKAEDADDALMSAWAQVRTEFESLQDSGSMNGPAARACHLAVQRLDEEVVREQQRKQELFQNVNSAMDDDIRTEEESSGLFQGGALGG